MREFKIRLKELKKLLRGYKTKDLYYQKININSIQRIENDIKYIEEIISNK